jgi:hypothetical protein
MPMLSGSLHITMPCNPSSALRHEGHGEDAPAGLFLELGHRVVVDAGAGEAEVGVLDLQEVLVPEAREVRVDDLGVDTVSVQHVDASLHVVGGGVDVLVSPREELDALCLGPVPGHDTRGDHRAQVDVSDRRRGRVPSTGLRAP